MHKTTSNWGLYDLLSGDNIFLCKNMQTLLFTTKHNTYFGTENVVLCIMLGTEI